MGHKYAGSIYSTLQDAQRAAIIDWFSGTGNNSIEETLDQATAPDMSGYVMAQEMAAEGWSIPEINIQDVAKGDEFSHEIDELLADVISELRGKIEG